MTPKENNIPPMNAARAREIVWKFERGPVAYAPAYISVAEYTEAEGYLAALDGPEVKALIDVLEGERWVHTDCWCETKGEANHSRCIAFDEALATFKEVTQEKKIKGE